MRKRKEREEINERDQERRDSQRYIERELERERVTATIGSAAFF